MQPLDQSTDQSISIKNQLNCKPNQSNVNTNQATNQPNEPKLTKPPQRVRQSPPSNEHENWERGAGRGGTKEKNKYLVRLIYYITASIGQGVTAVQGGSPSTVQNHHCVQAWRCNEEGRVESDPFGAPSLNNIVSELLPYCFMNGTKQGTTSNEPSVFVAVSIMPVVSVPVWTPFECRFIAPMTKVFQTKLHALTRFPCIQNRQ